MTAVARLVPVAVVGTARRELDPGWVSADTHGLPPAQALLVLAARAAVSDRVRLPAVAPAEAEPLPREVLPAPASPRYVGSLGQALGGQRWAAVVESLRHLAATGRRVPVSVLHRLLAAAESRRELRAPLGAVLGVRGAWLAAANPSWAFPEWERFDTADETIWQTGTRGRRVAWLAAVRAVDPSRARRLLTETLPDTDAAGRAALVAVLRDGITGDDEPLLERLLDDRSREVRATVRELLPSVPGSAYVARMRARVSRRIDPQRGRRFGVDLDGLDDADARDGVVVPRAERPPGAAAVRAMVGGVPLAVWARDLGVPAVGLAGLRDGGLELGPLPGLRDAALRERDAEVAEAVLLDARWPADPRLVGCLDPDRADRTLARRAAILGPVEAVAELRVQGFGETTAGLLLGWLRDSGSRGRRGDVLATLGDHGPPDADLASALRGLGAGLPSPDRNRAFDAAMTINLRRSLRAEADDPESLENP